jgi:hypothetical protein
MENASVDDTDAATTIFFATDGKTYYCLSILTFVIQDNVEQSNSSIYVFKRSSLSTGPDFTDAVLNVGGSGEGDSGDNGKDAAP